MEKTEVIISEQSLDFNPVDIPNQDFFKIGEVSELTGLKPYVLRFWETEFKELSPEKSTNNQRKYTRSEIMILLRIKELLYKEKYTIDGAKQKLKEMKKGNESSEKPNYIDKNEFKSTLQELKKMLLEIQNDLNDDFNDSKPHIDI